MTFPRTTTVRAFAVGLVLTASLAACGSSDPVAEPDEPASTTAPESTPGTTDPSTDTPTTPADTTAPIEGPVSTVSPDIPEEFLPGVGPVDVAGASLPVLSTEVIEDDEALGMQVPVILGEDFDGNPVRIDPAVDGPTMVVVVAHWCPHCNAEIPVLNELRDADRFPGWLNIVAVSTSARPDAPNFPPAQWFEDVDWTYPVVVDGVDMEQQTFIAADAYGVSGFPFIALVDGDGKVAARWSGEAGADEVINRINSYLSPF